MKIYYYTDGSKKCKNIYRQLSEALSINTAFNSITCEVVESFKRRYEIHRKYGLFQLPFVEFPEGYIEGGDVISWLNGKTVNLHFKNKEDVYECN